MQTECAVPKRTGRYPEYREAVDKARGWRLRVTCVRLYGEDVLDYAKVGDPMGTVVFEGFGRTLTYEGGKNGLNLEQARRSITTQIVTDLLKLGERPDPVIVKRLCNAAFERFDGNQECACE